MSASPCLPLMIVDDDDDLRDALADIMTAQGYEVAAFADAATAQPAIAKTKPRVKRIAAAMASSLRELFR